MAALLFLTLMAGGAALLVAGKLQFPSLGSGAGPFDILRAIGLIALASLGVTIDLDGLELSVVPLGLLAIVAAVFIAMSRQFTRDPERTLTDVPAVGFGFGLMCCVAAFVFRFGGDAPVAASPVAALLYGTLWGILLSGGASTFAGRGPVMPVRAPPPVDEMMRDAVRCLPVAAYGALVALLGALIVRLASDPLPRSFGLGDAVAATLYLIAFLPNVLVALFSLGVGAAIEVGAQFDVGGEMVGPLRTISLWDWGSAPPLRWFLVALPLAVGIALGVRTSARHRELTRALLDVVGTAALLALAIGLLAAVGDARLGAGLVKQDGVGLVAVNARQTTILTFLWITCVGTLSVLAARIVRRRSEGWSP